VGKKQIEYHTKPRGDNPWDDDAPFSYAETWLGSRQCISHINRKISGEDTHWLHYAIGKYFSAALEGRAKKPISQHSCLILGSNEGWIEQSLCKAGFTGPIIATDIAEKPLQRAMAKAAELGYTNVTHLLADLNDFSLTDKHDFVVAEGVLHHIENIEPCLRRLNDLLTETGVFILVEFEGAFRFQLPELQVRWINAALNVMPKALRPFPKDGEGDHPPSLKDAARVPYVKPTEESIVVFDPSEAYSGAALKELIPRVFRVVERKGFGGAILSYITGHFDFQRANNDPFASSFLEILIQLEDTLIDTGILQDDFVFYALAKGAAARGHQRQQPTTSNAQEAKHQ